MRPLSSMRSHRRLAPRPGTRAMGTQEGGDSSSPSLSLGAAERIRANVAERAALFAGAESGSWRTNVHRERFMVMNNITHKSMLAEMERSQAAVMLGHNDVETPWYLKENQEDVKEARRRAWREHKRELEKVKQRDAEASTIRMQALHRAQFSGKLVTKMGMQAAGMRVEQAHSDGGLAALDELVQETMRSERIAAAEQEDEEGQRARPGMDKGEGGADPRNDPSGRKSAEATEGRRTGAASSSSYSNQSWWGEGENKAVAAPDDDEDVEDDLLAGDEGAVGPTIGFAGRRGSRGSVADDRLRRRPDEEAPLPDPDSEQRRQQREEEARRGRFSAAAAVAAAEEFVPSTGLREESDEDEDEGEFVFVNGMRQRRSVVEAQKRGGRR